MAVNKRIGERIIGRGENPNGQTSETANGTVHGARDAPGWNKGVERSGWPAPGTGIFDGQRTGE